MVWPVGVKGTIPNVEGDSDLCLAISERGEAEFPVRAEGEGIVNGASYSLWLSNQNGDQILIDAASNIEKCSADVETGQRTCGAVASLYDDSTEASFEATSPAGLIAIIRECPSNADPIAVEIDVDSTEFALRCR